MTKVNYISRKFCEENSIDYNNNNFTAYRPFYDDSHDGDSKLHIDNAWFHQLSPFIRDKLNMAIVEQGVTIIVEDIVYPHSHKPINNSNMLYTKYFQCYDFHNWFFDKLAKYMLNSKIYMFELTPKDKSTLRRIPPRVFRTKPLHSEELEDLEEIKVKLDNGFANIGDNLFIRTSTGSMKDLSSKIPVYNNSVQVLNDLTQSERLYIHEFCERDKRSFIIMTDYKKLDPKYEFRLFVHQGKIVACSQQHCYTVYQYNDVETIVEGLNKIEWIDLIPYNDFIADIYFDANKFKLIECNAYGIWAPGGSSLFNWITDYDLLYGKKDHMELRILVD